MSPSQELYTSRETQHVGTRAYAAGSWDPVYHAKANILNDDLQKIGMGKYQVCSSGSSRRNNRLMNVER